MKITAKDLYHLVELFEIDYPDGVDSKLLQEWFVSYFDDVLDNLK